MRLSDGEIPADGQQVLWRKSWGCSVGRFYAAFGIGWWLHRDYDAWDEL